MTYWQYHLIFTLPLIVFLAFHLRRKITRAHLICWAVVCLIAFIFTTPWDNYAVSIGIWGFGENVSLWYPFSEYKTQTRFLGHIPVEEYAYFIIESTLACLVTLFFLPNGLTPKN